MAGCTIAVFSVDVYSLIRPDACEAARDEPTPLTRRGWQSIPKGVNFMIHPRPPTFLGFPVSESTTPTIHMHIGSTVLGFRLRAAIACM